MAIAKARTIGVTGALGVSGLNDLLRQFKTLDKEINKTIRRVNIEIAKEVSNSKLSWDEDDGQPGNKKLRIIVMENLFEPHDLLPSNSELVATARAAVHNKDSDLIARSAFEIDLEQNIINECNKYGTIEKITLFEYNPRGICVVKFTTAYDAQQAVKCMNGQYIGNKVIRCYFYDGKTDYTVSADDIDVNASTLHTNADVSKGVNEGSGGISSDKTGNEELIRADAFGDWLESQKDLPEELRLRTAE